MLSGRVLKVTKTQTRMYEMASDVSQEPVRDKTISSNNENQMHNISQNAQSGIVSKSDPIKKDISDMLDHIPQLSKYFEITEKIGSGTFSSVYLARVRCNGGEESKRQQFALKHIIPTSHPSRIENELRCLRDVGGRDNIIGLSACVRHNDHVVIAMPYFPHDRFHDYVRRLSVDEIRLYMKSLLVALARVHSVDLIHRDVKPSNFLFNRKRKQFALVDFGLAQRAPIPLHSAVNQIILSNDFVRGNKAIVDRKKFTQDSCQSGAIEQWQMASNEPVTNDAASQVTYAKLTPSSLKRKRDVDENGLISPRKRRLIESKMSESKDVNMAIQSHENIFGSSERNLQPIDINKLDIIVSSTPSCSVPKIKSKSPRRALLTKRILDLHQNPAAGDCIKVNLDVEDVTHKETDITLPHDDKDKDMSNEKFKVIKSHHMPLNNVPSSNISSPSAGLGPSCDCFGQPMVCRICLARSSQNAPRAGTSGFRAPEVLLRHPEQTTSVDIWAAGIIFLSLLSGRYPFFKSGDDMNALAQIMAVFGTEPVKAAAKSYGKCITTNVRVPQTDLRHLCERLRSATSMAGTIPLISNSLNIPDSAYDLLHHLLDLNPSTRITAEKALTHSFFIND